MVFLHIFFINRDNNLGENFEKEIILFYKSISFAFCGCYHVFCGFAIYFFIT